MELHLSIEFNIDTISCCSQQAFGYINLVISILPHKQQVEAGGNFPL